LLGRGQPGMAANEQEPQHVVAVMARIDALGDAGFRVFEVGEKRLLGQRLLAGPLSGAVDCHVAADEDEPGGRVTRRSGARPRSKRAQGGLLECLLGGIEVAEIAQERGDRLGSCRRERRADPVDVGHAAPTPGSPGRKRRTGRTS